ncbi:21S rRNA (uridine2791-2'-O) methyltransferase KNAG_0F01850 [Huiozyma naganishii CBS 8797]|uniref:rRNA methyltransferase 2, mitochondrial n=1 Tax=Huiozyma naganishii (strain ATCC MYA-139 / BCRC 22969 / CBS 8797 / KCTC 17520 / NBRC 10181 / NCYC 3082 / Yp74L-3) TaxID=1071383 RepID=J7RMQ3_HUIN7|nr:hypothetical protein KNAG_0F01850 [Kazachstania naganishii CBS 8797]CCK70853.1 hypothetical protein KNAG_0F01850 [Kazachstania naganishii CBS 8797]
MSSVVLFSKWRVSPRAKNLVSLLPRSGEWLRLHSSSSNKWINRQQNDVYSKEAKLRNLKSRASFKLMEIDDKYKLFKSDVPQSVLDLGFAPGSWSLVARQRTDPSSMILGVDILPCEPPRGVSSLQANILSSKTQDLIRLYFSKHFQVDRLFNTHSIPIDKDHGYLPPRLNTIEDTVEREAEQDNEEYREIFTADDHAHTGKIAKRPIDVILSDMLMNTSGVPLRDHLLSIDLCDAALVTAIDLLKPKGAFVCKLYRGKEDKSFEKRLRSVFDKVHIFKPASSRSESKEAYFVGLKKKAKVDKVAVFTS